MRFLYDPQTRLFGIGYAVGGPLEFTSHYDLLASECRLASLVAIAKGDVPIEHWFALGRPRAHSASGQTLLSWNGAMFEYLMPLLFTRTFANSLLDEACRQAVRLQIRYGQQRGVPWGISESAYNTRDLDQTYQYSPFGVPALGLKRGLANDMVISPYATGLAAMLDAPAAAANFRELDRWGALGHYGYYEALDFTPDRLAEGDRVAVVRAYMAHHQGMTIVGIANGLRGGITQGFFHAEAAARATELLMQERPPRSVEAPPEGSEAEAREGRLPVLAGFWLKERQLRTGRKKLDAVGKSAPQRAKPIWILRLELPAAVKNW
jgi:cyclic beta-1,2-glucan synthetase